jgi:hypothetical protein
MEAIKEFLKALYCMFTFKRYTIFARWFEVGVGILVWLWIIVILYCILN